MNTFLANNPLPMLPNNKNIPARPNILMFGDYGFIDDRVDEQYENFDNWISQYNKNSKICIIEIGAGKAVPTVRNFSETLYNKYKYSSLIRINPRESDIPKYFNDIGERGIELPLTGLDALKKIKTIYDKL